MDNLILLYGCGGHSRSVTDILLANDVRTNICYIDENARDGELLYGFKVLARWQGPKPPYFLAIGDNAMRQKLFREIGSSGLISVISGKAHVGHHTLISPGVFIGNFCHIGPEVVVGINTIVNNGAIIEHEVSIGEHSHLAPNVAVSGKCKIGDLVFIGVGASVKDNIEICSNVIVGAGATVVKNITVPGVYIGTPACKVA